MMNKAMTTSITGIMQYGNKSIHYALLRAKRKTLEIAVHPDGRVLVKAPLRASQSAIEAKIYNKARWIHKQLKYFAQFQPRTPARQYVSGESHRYLGRQYRLKIVVSNQDRVRLTQGYFWIETTDKSPSYIKQLLDRWYRARANDYLCKLFEQCWLTFPSKHLTKPHLKLRKMRKRWGSLSAKGRLTLNTKLIQAPKDCIEYVLIHELCHLVHYNHSAKFYRLLARILPDWRRLKDKLEMALI